MCEKCPYREEASIVYTHTGLSLDGLYRDVTGISHVIISFSVEIVRCKKDYCLVMMHISDHRRSLWYEKSDFTCFCTALGCLAEKKKKNTVTENFSIVYTVDRSACVSALCEHSVAVSWERRAFHLVWRNEDIYV